MIIELKAFLCATAILALLSGCHGVDRNGVAPSGQEVISSRPVAKESEKPYLLIDEGQRKMLIQKVQKIQIGTSCEEVKSVLGPPWSDDLQYKKDWSHELIGRTFDYYVRKQDKDLVNEKLDQYVEFRFDPDNRLTSIYAQNVAGIVNRP